MEKMKKSQIPYFGNQFREKKGLREEALAYAFLRGVPYKVVENKTHWELRVLIWNMTHRVAGYALYGKMTDEERAEHNKKHQPYNRLYMLSNSEEGRALWPKIEAWFRGEVGSDG